MDAEQEQRALAPPDTLLGQLQRGRGAGFLAAREEFPSLVRPLLLECITHDPRWDRQVEHRGDYYADLVMLTEMELAPLAEHLRTHDDEDPDGWNVPLTLNTLGSLARRGREDALEILRDYMAFGLGWHRAFYALQEVADPRSLEGLDIVICRRYDTPEELEYQLGWFRGSKEPWKTWRKSNPRIARAFDDLEAAGAQESSSREAPPDYAAMTLEQLFGIVCLENSHVLRDLVRQKVEPSDLVFLLLHLSTEAPFRCYLALHGLAALADPAALAPLQSFLEANVELPPFVRTAARRALLTLPADRVIDLGRAWFDHPEWHFRHLGQEILEARATPEDIPRLRAAIEECLPSEEIYRLCSVADALARFRDLGPFPELERAFDEVPYSYARILIARALQSTAPDRFATGLARECLWDCEAQVREMGCASVDLRLPEARDRLAHLADCSYEDEIVRRAAGERLS